MQKQSSQLPTMIDEKMQQTLQYDMSEEETVAMIGHLVAAHMAIYPFSIKYWDKKYTLNLQETFYVSFVSGKFGAFYTPVFRRDVLWYGDVRPGLRPSDSRSVRSPSAHFPHFSPTCFDTLSWNFAHDFVLMYYRSSLTVVTLHQFLKELCLFLNLE